MKIARLRGKPEIFYTIQGEGVNLGVPSVFLRLSLCNLHCIWCDTPYTWNWDDTLFLHKDHTKYRRGEQIVEIEPKQVVAEVSKWQCRHLVITGGEPLVQQKELAVFFSHLCPATAIPPGFVRRSDWFIEVETNGTITPSPAVNSCVNQFNVSPKLHNSGNEKKLRDKEKALTWFAKHSYSSWFTDAKVWFKFVISTKDDWVEVILLVDKYKMNKQRVILMPEGRTQDELAEKSVFLVELCKVHGFRFTPRAHIDIYGAQRGV